MPGKILPVHHSLTDWDFRSGDTYRSLSSVFFISAPTSLKIDIPGAADVEAFLCRIPATQCLPQGEVRTWVRRNTPTYSVALFRNQAPLGSANHDNSYMLTLTYSKARLYRRIAGVSSSRGVTPCYTPINEWIHCTVFWYNGKTPGDVPALCVDLYREIAGEWVKEGETIYDTANTWKDSAINRAGLDGIAQLNFPVYYDDTEIWGPV